jgi:hypothetical protein
MTSVRFDARASNTWARRFARLPRLDRNSITSRMARLVRVAAQVARGDPATIAGHRRHLRALLRSFRNDIATYRTELRYLEAIVFCDFRRLDYLDRRELGRCQRDPATRARWF